MKTLPTLSRKVLLLFLVLFILIVAGIAINLKNTNTQEYNSPADNISQYSEVKPIATVVPVNIAKVQGKITKISSNMLTIKEKTATHAALLTPSSQLYSRTSGSLEAGDIVSQPITKTDLRVGQEVFITQDLQTKTIINLLLLK
jgi:hypothetical protein